MWPGREQGVPLRMVTCVIRKSRPCCLRVGNISVSGIWVPFFLAFSVDLGRPLEETPWVAPIPPMTVSLQHPPCLARVPPVLSASTALPALRPQGSEVAFSSTCPSVDNSLSCRIIHISYQHRVTIPFCSFQLINRISVVIRNNVLLLIFAELGENCCFFGC